MKTLEQALAERMKNPEFKAEYEALEPEFANRLIISTISYTISFP